MNKKYYFFKKIYPDVLLIMLDKNHYVSYELDDIIFCFFQNDLAKLKAHAISFVVLDNLDIVESYYFSDNFYYHYALLCFFN